MVQQKKDEELYNKLSKTKEGRIKLNETDY